MRQPRLLLTMLVLALSAGATSSTASAASPFKALNTSLTQGKKALGRKASGDLGRRAKHAKAEYTKHRWCTAVKDLGGLAAAAGKVKGDAPRRAAAASVATPARALQRKIFLAHAAGHGSCGLAAPKVRIDQKVDPTQATVPGINGGAPRAVSAVEGPGAHTDFVRGEVVIISKDPAKVASFVARWHGTILRERKPTTDDPAGTWLIRIQTAKADVAGLPADLRKLDPLARGTLKASDPAALQLLAITADAASKGLIVGPNLLETSQAVEDRTAQELGGNDPYGQWYNDPAKRIATGEAWRTMKLAGVTKNRVRLAVVDGGFRKMSGDFPTGDGEWDTSANQATCSGGNACAFHGTNVASAAGGVLDNGLGFAGSGGQVADIFAVPTDVGSIDAIYGVDDARKSKAKVINLSWGGEIDALISFANIPLEYATTMAIAHGALVVAAAGNDFRDVDAEDCFIVCWEEEIIAPCENLGVLCVGGITENGNLAKSTKADGTIGGSNFGLEWTGNATTSDVDIYAPFTVIVGPDPANAGNRSVNGTSFSAPFVSGIAAMMAAANPNLGPIQLAKGLMDTASGSPDSRVSRVVNADRAVKWALPTGLFPPFVKIGALADNTVPYGSFNTIKLSATNYSVGDSDPACCSYAWTSPKDGLLGTGASIDASFGTPGTRTVTVTATNTRGEKHAASIEVEATNQGPKLDVIQPKFGAKLLRGQTYKFDAKATDPNEFAGVACASIHWVISGAGANQVADGCTPAFKFITNGERTILVSVVDGAEGGKSSTQYSFSVIDPPLNAPPLVAIVSPDNGASLAAGVAVELKATAVDPDNGGAVAGTWSMKEGTVTTPLGAGNAISYLPTNTSCHSRALQLIFSATDGDGTSTATIDVSIPNSPC